MKQITAFLLIVVLTVTLCSCGEKPEKTREETSPTEAVNITTQLNSEELTVTEDNSLNELFAEFQGEWKQKKSDWHLIIDGNSLVIAYYEKIEDKIEEKNYEFYELIIDESDNIATKTYTSKSRQYILKINENGQIEMSNNKNDIITLYDKVSDNTTVPTVIHREKPQIGMTQEQVLSSTWGSPKKRNKTTTASGVTEQWIYEEGYIYFTNGYVTVIQE